ncbi:MAG TPA: hypothetical protein VG051_04135 [Candidatus Acidoferrum sp.]|jgi:hypothetical protein|nr:hypothetical protein [Candidatus Acidoferrum sp.]
MLVDPKPESRPARKNPLLYSSVAVAIALLYVGWVFFSRWQESRTAEQKTKVEATQKQRENDRASVELLGGNEFAIQMFYASPGVIRRGESTRLCYGVSNAKAVKLDPQSNPVWPSHSRCVEVAPAKTTTYTLTIVDAAGNTKSQAVEVKVH